MKGQCSGHVILHWPIRGQYLAFSGPHLSSLCRKMMRAALSWPCLPPGVNILTSIKCMFSPWLVYLAYKRVWSLKGSIYCIFQNIISTPSIFCQLICRLLPFNDPCNSFLIFTQIYWGNDDTNTESIQRKFWASSWLKFRRCLQRIHHPTRHQALGYKSTSHLAMRRVEHSIISRRKLSIPFKKL